MRLSPPYPLSIAAIRWRKRLRQLAVALACGACQVAAHASGSDDVLDVTQRPFEELLNTDIITAAKLAQQISGAPSAVSVVTAQDIRVYGYRTLDDILDSMRGLHMAHDFAYGYLAGRGYSDPGDYAGRITLLIDGYSAADGFFGQSYFGQDGFLDAELIERVEYIPGTGSSDHGGGAFLGVINIITKKGGDFSGTQVAMDLASHRTRNQRVTWGRQYDNGAELLLSASGYRSAGRNMVLDSAMEAHVTGGNEASQRLFIKGSYQGWSLTSAMAQRPVHDPQTPGGFSTDTSGFTSLKYSTDLTQTLKLSSHAYVGQYRYDVQFGEAEAALGNLHFGVSRWWGLDTKLVSMAIDRHTLVLGSEFRNDHRQSYHLLYPTDDYSFHSERSRKTHSLYAYDDITLSPSTQLNLGLRHERRNNDTHFTSPRAALIFTPQPGSTFKLSSGISHRQPTAERESVPDLAYRIERLKTNELVWEQRLDQSTRLTSSLYRYDIDRRMDRIPDGGKLSAKGAELELERHWPRGARLRTSYAWQLGHDQDGQRPVNLPRHNAKFNFTTPLIGERLRLGLELHYLGRRHGYDDLNVPSTTVANLTLTSQNFWPHWHASLSLRNVFNRRYTDALAPGFGLSSFPRDGRNVWLQISRDFK